MAIILADARERNGAIPHLDACVAENNSAYAKLSAAQGGGEIKYVEDTLHTGDYAVLLEDQGKNRLALVIERKTWKDLSASIKDGRIRQQHKNMEELQATSGCIIMYMIEGNLSYNDSTQIAHIPFKNLHAKVRRLLLRNIPCIQTRDEKHSAKIIVDLARDIIKLHRAGELKIGAIKSGSSEAKCEAKNTEIKNSKTGSDKQQLINEYCQKIQELTKEYRGKFSEAGIPDTMIREIEQIVDTGQEIIPEPVAKVEDAVDEVQREQNEKENTDDVDLETLVNLKLIKRAGDGIVPAELKVRHIASNTDIIEKMWLAIPMVSDKTAPILMQKYSLADILGCTASQSTFIQDSIADLKYPSGARVGEVRAKKIMEIAYIGENAVRKEKLKEHSVKILAEIPGLTTATARTIVDRYSLRDICSGLVSEDQLGDIQKGANRKLGVKMGEKICSILTSKKVSPGAI